ncbi:MAG: ABC-2 transporter permease [Bacilli bacterium]|nr:ABC-2 transporter permease [Bacilli bacterium]
MKGLILKDILFIKNLSKNILIIFLALALMDLVNGNTAASFFLPFIAVMLSLSTFNYDAFNHWDTYMLTLPLKRKQIVRAKYIFALLGVFIMFLVAMVLLFASAAWKGNIDIPHLLEQGLGGFFAAIFVVSMVYPLLYKFGAEKGRIWFFVLCFGIGIVASLIGFIFSFFHIGIPSKEILLYLNQYGAYIAVLCIVIFYSLSYKISCHIYQKKEF